MRAVLVRGAALALAASLFGLLVAGSALAGGGPGGDPPPIRFMPAALTLAPTGEIILSGTVACTEPGEGLIAVAASEHVGRIDDDGPYTTGQAFDVAGGATEQITCDGPGVHDVSLTVAGDRQRSFRPGPATIVLEFEYATATNAGSMIGVLFPDLRPGENPV